MKKILSRSVIKNLGFIGAIILIAIALVYFFSLKPSAPTPKIVVVGLDGADWHILHPLIEQNKLPNMQSLIETGCAGVLRTVKPTISPVIWTSIATGKSMLKHGVLDWRYVNKNNIEIPYSVDDIRVKFVWEILSDYGKTVGVINWFCTFPAVPVNGYLISDRFRISVDKYLEYEGITYPPELYPKIYEKALKIGDRQFPRWIKEENIPNYYKMAIKELDDIPEKKRRQLAFFKRYFYQDKSVERVALDLLGSIPVDFFAVYFRLIDTTSHMVSLFIDKDLRKKWLQENVNLGGPSLQTEKKLFQNMTEIIAPVDVYMDNVVGRLKKTAPPETIFIIVSDHGFNFSTKGYNHYDTPEIPHGIIIISGPGIRQGHWLQDAHIYDLTPTLLTLNGIPIGEDMDGKVILDVFSQRPKVKKIATHDNGGRSSRKERSRDLDERVLEDLRTLGYIK